MADCQLSAQFFIALAAKYCDKITDLGQNSFQLFAYVIYLYPASNQGNVMSEQCQVFENAFFTCI